MYNRNLQGTSAIEELDETQLSFTAGDVMKKLNKELGTCITSEELERELVGLGLDGAIPAGGKAKGAGKSK